MVQQDLANNLKSIAEPTMNIEVFPNNISFIDVTLDKKKNKKTFSQPKRYCIYLI